MAANDDIELDEIRAAIKAAKLLNLPPDGESRDTGFSTILNSAESQAIAVPPGEVATPPCARQSAGLRQGALLEKTPMAPSM